jgi:hypothetical protein
LLPRYTQAIAVVLRDASNALVNAGSMKEVNIRSMKMMKELYTTVVPSSLRAERSNPSHREAVWIASSRSLSSGAHSRDPLAPRNDG